MQHKIPAVFMRGGTSRAVFFREDVMTPYDQVTRDNIILTALGSPDPDGRQIDGLGGGISSLSTLGRSQGELPFMIKGTTSNPIFVPDVGKAIGNSVTAPAQGVGGLLNGLFGKKKNQ